MLHVRTFWSVFIGLTVSSLLIGSVALLYGQEKRRDQPTFITPKTGDPLYVLDRWFMADLRLEGNELVLVLNLATYGKPQEKIRALGLVFKDKEKALVPFKNLVHALEALKPKESLK